MSDGTTIRTNANRRRAIRALLKSYKHIDLVVCEPTGGHEGLLLKECLRAGIACHRVTRSRSRTSSVPTARKARATRSMPPWH
ncbi:hypothetical protein NKJ04_14595 [Mesorhizobium sp. M0618]|uniref:hypothetical protein n=1 Tax=Mesorhizobium sp. M0618 TaxID=2956972 RepID=UPI00333A9E54